MISTILIFVIVLGLLVFVHELGHFLMAKKMGMKVEEFGFGFPPRIWGKKKGGTIYSINWIPLGGFVKIKGESGEHRNEDDSFSAKKPLPRFLVLVSGVVMNLILAAVLISIGFMIGLPSVVDESTSKNARIQDEKIRIIQVLDNSPASESNIEVGDTLISIDGRLFASSQEAHNYIGKMGGNGIRMMVQKEDQEFYEIDLTSRELKEVGISGIGVGIISTGIVSYAPHLAVYHGVVTTGQLTKEIVVAFFDIIKNLILKQEVSLDISGPVGIAVLTSKVAALGLIYLLQFTAILSINLAVINILPFPALDGGRILFLALEKALGRKVDEKIEGVVHNLGFALLMVLVILVTYRDLVKYGGEIIGTLKGLIGA